MKHSKLLPVWMLALALGLVAGTMALTACTGGGDTASDSEQTAEPSDAKEETTQDAADEADQQPADDGSVWVVTKEVGSYEVADSSSEVEISYELDEHGNAVKLTQTQGAGFEPYVATNTFDEDGYITQTTDSLGEGSVLTYTLEKDEQGRLTKSTGSDGTTEEITYDDAGNIAKRVITGSAMGEDPEGNWTVTGTYSSTTVYDENGHVSSVLNENGETCQLVKKTFTYNDAGQITSVKNEYFSGTNPDNLEPDASPSVEGKVEYDDNGNIARITEEGEAYTYVTKYEYTKVENPSLAVRLNARNLYV